MNKERPNERDARQIVESVVGMELEHADSTGGVDYRSISGQIAVEVTRITDGQKKAAREALRASTASLTPDNITLQNCWVVFLPDTQRGMKTMLQVLPPLFTQLEAVGETHFDGQVAAAHVIKQGALAHIYRPLLAAGVERAAAHPHGGDPTHAHGVIPSLGSGGSSGGSNEAVALITRVLAERTDNVTKLERSGATERHLFVWLDDDTRFDIARPLSRHAPAWADEGFGLPSRSPKVPAAITHLWIVHERSRLGWLWDGEDWHELCDLPERTAG